MFFEASDICNQVSEVLKWFEEFYNENPKRQYNT